MKLSVCMISYNHEKYIEQSVLSAVQQVTTFPFEIVICEDHSTDNTAVLLSNLQEKYPDKIRLYKNDTNLGIMPNFIRALNACKGDYIALLEGDDYWTDSAKLQIQVDFLDIHPEYSVACHTTEEFSSQIEKKEIKQYPANNITLTINDLLKGGNPIFTPSITCRNYFKQYGMPTWFTKIPYGDLGLLLFCARFGLIWNSSHSMGVHRIHQGGAWSGIDFEKRINNDLTFYNTVLHENDFISFKREIRRIILLKKMQLILELKKNKQTISANKILAKTISRYIFTIISNLKIFLSFFIQAYLPSLYCFYVKIK
jgi:glycosyltransferase involved in cell wall biosynthesis